MALRSGASGAEGPGRVAWVDVARGIGIVLVVAGHVERGLVAASVARGPLWPWSDYALYTFHMPLFFVLAGINVPRSLAKGRGSFLRGKLWTIAYPYVLWSLVQGAVLVSLSRYTNGHADPSDLLRIGWAPMSQFWFLYALMICHAAAALLAPSRPALLGAAILSLGGTALLPHGSIAAETLHAFPFYAAGILLSRALLAWPPGGDGKRLLAALIGLAIAVPLSGRIDGLDFDAFAALPATVCGIVALLSLARLATGNAAAIAEALGAASMTIYVLHILAASGARIVMVHGHVPPSPWLFLAVCTSVGVAVPFAVHRVLERRHLLGAFGLAPLPARRDLLVVT